MNMLDIYYVRRTALDLYLICLIVVAAQDAFPVTLTAHPDQNVPIRSAFKLKCSFLTHHENFLRVRILENDKLIYDFPGSPSDEWPRIARNGTAISENPEVVSVIWVTIKAHLCDSQSGPQIYKCLPFNRHYEYGTGTRHVTYAGPSQKLYINGSVVCQNGTHTVDSETTNILHTIKLTTSNNRTPVNALTLKIGDSIFNSSQENNVHCEKCVDDGCSYSAAVEGEHVFAESKEYTASYTVISADNEKSGYCTIIVKGKAGFRNGPIIAGLILAIHVIVVGTLFICYRQFVTKGSKRETTETKDQNIEVEISECSNYETEKTNTDRPLMMKADTTENEWKTHAVPPSTKLLVCSGEASDTDVIDTIHITM